MNRATDKPAHTAVRQGRQWRKRGRGATANSISRRRRAQGAYASAAAPLPLTRSPLVLLLLILLWSISLGCGLGLAMDVRSNPKAAPPNLGEVSQLPQRATVTSGASGGTVDPVNGRYQLGQQLYLENCSTCHIALPPAVFPSETWRTLLQDEQHYGTQLQPLISPSILIVWDYMQTFSRTHTAKERVPYRLGESRYFKALHPRVKLPRTVKIADCVTCHPAAPFFNFRRLTPEWENSP